MRCWLYLGFTILSFTAHAQNWRALFASAQEAYQQEKIEEALSLSKQCLEAYQKEDGSASDNYAAVLRLVGNVHFSMEAYAEGLAFIQQEIRIREVKKDVNYANALENESQFYMAIGQYEAAVLSLQKARSVLELFYREADIVLLTIDLLMASNLYLANNSQKAFELYTKTFSSLPQDAEVTGDAVTARYYFALLSLEKKLGDNAAQQLEWLKNYYELADLQGERQYHEIILSLADARVLQLRLEDAEKLLAGSQQVLETNQQTKEELYVRLVNARASILQKIGKSQEAAQLFDKVGATATGATLAIALNNKAALAQQAGNLTDAEKLYREALASLSKTNDKEMQAYAETEQNLAVLLTEQNRFKEAIDLLNDALLLLEKNGAVPSVKVAACLNKKAHALLRTGNVGEAQKTYQQALSVVNDSSVDEWVVANNGIAVGYQQLGEFEKADSIIQQIFGAYDQGIRENLVFASVLNNYAALKQIEGQLLTSRDLLEQAAIVTRKNAGALNLPYATALENIAFVNLQMGELDAAKVAIDSVLLITEKILTANSEEYASALINLGRYYQYAGDFSKAEPQFKKAMVILDKTSTGTQAEKIRATNGLATFYLTMGNYEEAEPLYNKSRKLIETQYGGKHAEYSTTLQNLATLYQLQGKFVEAEKLLFQSLELDKATFGEEHPQYAISLQNLATVYQKQGEFLKAQPLLEQVLHITENSIGKDHPSYSITLSNLAALYQDTRQPDKAEKAWRESVELRKRILGVNHPDYARSLYGLATITFAKGNYAEAKKMYESVVINYLEQIRENFPSMSEKEKGAFYAKIKPVFDTYQDFCVQYYHRNKQDPQAATVLKELYDIQLATKAILLNATNKVRSRILNSGDAELVKTFQQWISLKEEIVRYYTLSEEERKTQMVDVMQLQQQANELEKSLSEKSELFKSQFDQQIIQTEQIAQALKADEAAVEIIRLKRKFETDSIYYVGLVLHSGNPIPSLVVWPHGTKLETRFYRYHRNTIKFKYTDSLSYKYYWQPLEPALEAVRHVYISSDGIFNKVNVNTLRNPKTKQWVLDNFSIGLVSNTNEILVHAGGGNELTPSAYLFGDVDFNGGTQVAGTTRSLARSYGFADNVIPNLPATEKEVDEIQSLLSKQQWSAQQFKTSNATEENLKKLDNPRLIHIATHGYFMSDIDMDDREGDRATFFNNPLLRSGILLAGAAQRRVSASIESGEDGALSAYEAMNLYLENTDLVVLSACETGLGEVRNGEGVYGLQRSFLVAGSKAVMMSLWQVDDVATQELMVKFYSLWLSTGNRQEAFRQAQIALKEKYNDPYFWGAFVMIGN